MKIAILGFAREGRSILKFFQKRGLTQTKTRTYANKDEIWVLDKNPDIQIPRGVRAQFGKNYLRHLEKFDVIFRSPGIPYLLPEIQKARKQGVEISSATKLFFDEIEKRSGFGVRGSPIVIGITGTKGKGTTSTLLYKILKASGKKVFLAGNIGKPALDILPKIDKKSIVIFELSSFQLQDLKKSPHTAAVLDIFPDHLDAHKNLKEYYDAKANIGRYQKSDDKIFYFGNNALSRKVANHGNGKKIAVNPYSPHSCEWWNEIRNASKLPGEHNFKNAVMAATIAESLGVPKKIILKTVKKFSGLEHRMEFVRAIRRLTQIHPHTKIWCGGKRRRTQIYFYNDSAAVNPGSAIAALETTGKNTILIAGGKERGLDYSMFAKAIKKYAKSVILIGENKNKILHAIKKVSPKKRVPITVVKNMKEAVETAYRQATLYALHSTLCNVLLSPASASFDVFKNYGERGEIFKKEVMKLK